MKKKVEAIAQLYGEQKRVSIKEDFEQLVCEVELTLKRTPDEKTLQILLPTISGRDSWRLQLSTDSDDDLYDLRAGTNIAEACGENKLQPYCDEDVILTYSITKTKRNDTLTVYDYALFLDYINGLAVTESLNAFQNKLAEKLVLEIWSERYERFNTSSIAFIKKDDVQPILTGNDDRKKRRVVSME